MKEQMKKRISRWCRPVTAMVLFFACLGALNAQNANKDGFQAAGNKQLGFALKEHRDGSWRGDILGRLSMPDNKQFTISNFTSDGDIVFTGGGTWNNTGSWTELFRITQGGNLRSITNGGRNSFTIKTNDNTQPTGIAFQNSGDMYAWNIFREDRGENFSDLVISAGKDPDIDALTEYFRITKDGDVGIGISAPSAKLSVVGRIHLADGNENTSVGNLAGSSITEGVGNSNFGDGAGFRITEGDNNSNFGWGAGQSITTGYRNSNFGYGAGGLGRTGRLNSNFGYHAGIVLEGKGNTSLGAQAGTGTTNTDVHYSVFLGYNAGSDFGHVTFEDGNPIDEGKSVFVLNNQAQLHNPLLFGTFADNSDHDDPASHTTSGSMAQLAINTHHLVDSCALTVAGGVHIGPKNLDPTSFPVDTLYEDFLLWVERGIVTEDLAFAEVDEWADHVFEPHYDLADLDEVEQYIREHGHLPNIPSRAEVSKSGYSVQQLNARFLEKIEELTLHAIEQEKEIKRLKEAHSVQWQAMADRISALEALVNK